MTIEDSELKAIIERKAKELSRKSEYARAYDRITSECPHGIYVYDKSREKWIFVRSEGDPLKLGEFGDGVYVIYFDNTRCPACKKYDIHWFPYVKFYCRETGCRDTHFVIVLCEWFAKNCKSEAASKSFREYNIVASPTTVVALVEGGKKVYEERYEGYLVTEELEKVVGGFRERAEKAKRGEPVEKPIKRETTAELIKKILEQLGIKL